MVHEVGVFRVSALLTPASDIFTIIWQTSFLPQQVEVCAHRAQVLFTYNLLYIYNACIWKIHKINNDVYTLKYKIRYLSLIAHVHKNTPIIAMVFIWCAYTIKYIHMCIKIRIIYKKYAHTRTYIHIGNNHIRKFVKYAHLFFFSIIHT